MDKMITVPEEKISVSINSRLFQSVIRGETTINVVVIDSSTSMRLHKQTMIECIKEHLEGLKNPADGRSQYCVVVSFDDEYRILFSLTFNSNVEINDLPIKKYNPDGNTLLYKTVDDLLYALITAYENLSEDKRNNLEVAVGVFTDGVDNKSDPSLYPQKLAATSERAQNLGFMLILRGMGVEAEELADKMCFPREFAMTVDRSPEGIRHATRTYTVQTTQFSIEPFNK